MESAKGFHDRVQAYAENAKKKVEKAREEYAERQMKECSFAPKTLHNTERRNFQDFLHAQQQHLQKKQIDINKLIEDNKQKQEGELMGHPEINLKSRVLATTKQGPSAPVHERLFAISKKQPSIAVNPVLGAVHP